MSPLLLAASGAVLALLCITSPVVGFDTSAPSVANDNKVLQYALILERLESAFYTAGQAKFSSADFTTAGYPSGTWDYFNVIRTHEAAHVSTLVSVLSSTTRGQTPNAACTYNFTAALKDVASYVSTATVLEATGESAYDGALNAFTDTGLAQVAATIATIEARHTAFLRNLQTTSPFPDALTTAKTPTEVVAAAGGFFTSCPFTIADFLPIIRPSGVKTATTLSAFTTSSTAPIAAAKYSQAQFDNDLVALNYALTLERFEAAFYNFGQGKFTEAEFLTAFPTVGTRYYTLFGMIRDHENAHVSALTTTINNRQANTAVPNCVYNFTTINSVATYVATAQVLERTGVNAYAGAANTIVDTGLQQVAATIATVEAEHAAFLNRIRGDPATDPTAGSDGQGNFDTATAPTDIIRNVLATGLLTSCPYTVSTPTVVAYNAAHSATEGSAMWLIAMATVAVAATLMH